MVPTLRLSLAVLLSCVAPAIVHAQTTAFYVKSLPSDPSAPAAEFLYTPADGVQFLLTQYTLTNGIVFGLWRPSPPAVSWHLRFGAGGARLEPRLYPVAVSGAQNFPEFSVSEATHGCSGYGRFNVLEVVYDSSGTLQRLAVDAEQRCYDGDDLLVVAFRYNSTISSLEPFAGQYPRFELQLTPPANGRIVGDGIECGTGSAACTRTLDEPQTVALTAIPDPGFIFTGWSGRCSGMESTAIEVSLVTVCSATFTAADPGTPWTALFWDSAPGSFVGGGERSVYTPANSVWGLARYPIGELTDLWIRAIEGDRERRIDIRFPTAHPVIAPGTYVDNDGAYPHLVTVSKDARGCSSNVSTMTVHEWEVDTDGVPTKMAIDLEIRCPSTAPPLHITLRYKTTVFVPLRSVALQQTPASSVRFGQPISWVATASPGGGVEHAFWIRRAGGGWREVQPYGSSNTFSWTPAYADIGDHEIQVRARRLGTLLEVAQTRSFTVAAGWTPVVQRLSTNSPLPVSAGAAITWIASTAGGERPTHFQFWLRDANGWRMVQDYGASNAYTLQTTSADAGTYALQVWARNSDSPAAYESHSGVTFQVRAPEPLSVTLRPATASAPPWPAGARITWVALARGGIGPLEYQYWIRDPAGVWTKARGYTADPTFAWSPTVPGTYHVQVWVKHAGSVAAWDAYGSGAAEITAGEPLSVRWSSAPAGRVTAGRRHYWQAEARGGTAGPLEYQFWRYNGQTGTWTILQPWGASRQVFWTPTTAELGSYALQVWVRNAGSTAPYDAWLGASVTVVDQQPVTAVQVSADTSFPAPPGLITWRARSDSPDAEYRFLVLSPNGTWSIIRDYLPVSSATFLPSLEGVYALQVWARRGTSTAAYEAYAQSGAFEVRNNAAPLKLTALRSEPALALASQHFSIRWTAQISGGTSGTEFEFLLFDEARNEWSVAQEWSSSPIFDWIPSRPGRYVVQVLARPAGSTEPYTDARTSETFTVAAAASNAPAWIALDRQSPVAAGTPLTVTAGVTGAGEFEYRFSLYRESGSTTVLQDWSTSSTTVWTAVTPGAYQVLVTVRRAGNITPEATVSTATTIVQ